MASDPSHRGLEKKTALPALMDSSRDDVDTMRLQKFLLINNLIVVMEIGRLTPRM